MSAEANGESLLSLPPDVLFAILAYCDYRSLGRLAQVCWKINELVRQDYLWIKKSKTAIITNQLAESYKTRCFYQLGARDKCRIATNWRKSLCENEELLVHKTCYMPWLQLSSRKLWYSKGNKILCFARQPNGGIAKNPLHVLKGHVEDISRFICKVGRVVSGGRDKTICGWDQNRGRLLFCKTLAHHSDINSVDFNRQVIVSGSKDKTVKVWRAQNGSLINQQTIPIRDRVWSVAITPCERYLLTGSAGVYNIPPLQIFDLETCTKLGNLGSNYRNGAGVLDIYPESPHEFLSCGYDTFVRLWDTRSGYRSVQEWEDPHDSAVYCVTSDHKYNFISGTSRHGVVRLWDKRQTSSIQMFYISRGNSPVYSVNFDPCYMYIAVDRTLNVRKFTSCYGMTCKLN